MYLVLSGQDLHELEVGAESTTLNLLLGSAPAQFKYSRGTGKVTIEARPAFKLDMAAFRWAIRRQQEFVAICEVGMEKVTWL